MNNKILTSLILALMIGVIVYFFIQAPHTNQKTATSNAELEKKSSQSEYNLRFGHNLPINSGMHKAAIMFAEEVFRQTQGRVSVTVFPNQELGNDHHMVEMARAGELDILLTPTAKMSVPVPAMQFADLPFLFPDREVAYAVLDGEPGQLLLKKLSNINLTGVTFWENGFKHFTANKSLTTPDDFSGMKMRVMKSRIIMEQFKALGATPVPIDFHATRQALADGVVDGQENPLVAIVNMGFHEVQSHITLSSHAYLGYVLSFSSKVYDDLPQDIQQILKDAVTKVTQWQRQETLRKEAEFIAVIEQAGVIVEKLTPEQRQLFEEKTRDIADQFKLIIGAEILSKAYEIIQASSPATTQ